jgi:hypothetical protein
VDELNLNSIIARNEEMLSGVVDDEIVMLNMDSDQFHHINETGRRIWELLETPRSVAEVCDILFEEFEVRQDTCQKEVLDFFKALRARGVVLVSRPE